MSCEWINLIYTDMKKLMAVVVGLMTLASSCVTEDEGCGELIESRLVSPQISASLADENLNLSALTGILEIYPCKAGTSIYYGNVINGNVTPFYATYEIVDGQIYDEGYNRELHLPMGTYNMVYWGTPKYEEPIYSTPSIETPGFTVGMDLNEAYFELRQNSDGTYNPVYDLVYAVKSVNVGAEDLKVDLKRAVAGLKVIVKKKNNGLFNSNVTGMTVRVTGIAERLNFYTAQPSGEAKTVKFDLVASADRSEMTNATVMLFPSVEQPKVILDIKLKDGSVHTVEKELTSTFTANTKLTLNIVVGEIYPGGNTGDFTIENWFETSETIEFPVIS